LRILDILAVEVDHVYRWPSGDEELYRDWIEYQAAGSDRKRAVVWIDGHPHAEFLGADDFERSGEVLSESKLPGPHRRANLPLPEEPIRAAFGLAARTSGPRVHNAWAVVANVADHGS
jgi:hypothetical protein